MNKLEEAIRVAFAEQGLYVTAHDVKAAAKACMPFIEKAYDAAYFQSANDQSKEVSYYRYADRKEKWLKGNIWRLNQRENKTKDCMKEFLTPEKIGHPDFEDAATNYFQDEPSTKAGIQLQKDAWNAAIDAVMLFINNRNMVQVDELKAFKI